MGENDSVFEGEYTDQVWNRIKAWAKTQAAAASPPTLEECIRGIEAIIEAVLGPKRTFPQRVIEFYASEASAMVEELRLQLGLQPRSLG